MSEADEAGEKRGATPKLRFPEFRDAVEWGHLPLSQFVKTLDAGVSVNSGDRPARSGEAGILKTSAVTSGVFEPLENKVVSEKSELEKLKEPVCEDTIIISRMNTPAFVGANAYVKDGLENIFLPDRLWAAKPKPSTSMRFIAFVLGFGKTRAAISELATGTSGSMKNITKPAVLALQITAPSFPEQQKIADCLTSLDELIVAERQKLEHLQAHKKGLMQQLFPAEGETVPKLRFPEFQGGLEWEEKPLGSICNYWNGASHEGSITENGDYYLISLNSIDINGRLKSDMKRLSRTDNSLQRNDLVMVLSDVAHGNFLGLTDIIPNNRFVLNQRMAGLRTKNSDTIDVRFLRMFINLNQRYFKQQGQGSSQLNLSKSSVTDFTVLLPRLLEQQKVADCLSFLDELIAEQKQKIELLKTHKKGLMQQLFPSPDEALG